MISVIIPTLNCDADLAHTLAVLVPAAADGVVREVVVVDGGSTDHTGQVADAAGCVWVVSPGPRSSRIEAGVAASSRGEWLLFLSADTVLEPGWHHEVQTFIERAERAGSAERIAAAFKLRYESFGLGPRIWESWASVRTRFFGMPYGNQGLLITRRFYASLGGHRLLPELEDLDLVKRIGTRRLVTLRAAAVASGEPEHVGVATSLRRSAARFCVGMLRLPPRLVLKLHG
ncbi:glycosyltransferase [Roseibium sp. CAU 1637]|uniref:Glycosyltransferase n=1 Tax=Roseibium limicola TaxID=2816037 RepID=A0A939J796_9HYPH|nr:glycosyltransferase [Roseibium limicola]MBO0345937.1 glycosyltransferase [Roseibium limicola]